MVVSLSSFSCAYTGDASSTTIETSTSFMCHFLYSCSSQPRAIVMPPVVRCKRGLKGATEPPVSHGVSQTEVTLRAAEPPRDKERSHASGQFVGKLDGYVILITR